jgi:hypothetical protein
MEGLKNKNGGVKKQKCTSRGGSSLFQRGRVWFINVIAQM